MTTLSSTPVTVRSSVAGTIDDLISVSLTLLFCFLDPCRLLSSTSSRRSSCREEADATGVTLNNELLVKCEVVVVSFPTGVGFILLSLVGVLVQHI